MNLFELPQIPNSKIQDSKVLSKTALKVPRSISGSKTLSDIIEDIKQNVSVKLADYKDNYECVRTLEGLTHYINGCIENGICALDTETTGLNPMLDEIVGFSLYTPGRKAIYVPINHIDYITKNKLQNQLSKNEVKQELQRLVDKNVKIIMFNAKFDIRFLRHQIGVYLEAYWDGYIAQKLLNENEQENGLKALHKKYVMKNEHDAFSFSELFSDISFNLIPIQSGYIYAARDAEITYQLYEYQKQFLDKDCEKCIEKDLTRVADLYRNIEMPLINVVADMEDNGIKVDVNYLHKLSEKYNKILLEKEAVFYNLCDKYNDKIEKYRKAHPNNKLRKYD